ncbi:MAG: hypothetical protein IPJ32_18380 [Sphingobacteriaceae bacterium]|nr:hypothetical protein [Sphingobacteriaceae bacterium]
MKKTLFLPILLLSLNLNAQDTTKTPEVKATEVPVAKAETPKPSSKNPYFNFKNGSGFQRRTALIPSTSDSGCKTEC